jgi:hypothetical protein
MVIACVYINHLAVQVEVREHPELVGKPIVIGGFPHERKEVFDCSDEALLCDTGIPEPLRAMYSGWHGHNRLNCVITRPSKNSASRTMVCYQQVSFHK